MMIGVLGSLEAATIVIGEEAGHGIRNSQQGHKLITPLAQVL